VTNGPTNDSTLLLPRPTSLLLTATVCSSRNSVMPLVLLPRRMFACLQHCYFGLKEVGTANLNCPSALYRPVPFSAVPCSALQRFTVQCPSALYRPVSFSAIPSSALQRYTVQCFSALYRPVFFSVILSSALQRCTLHICEILTRVIINIIILSYDAV
jgi:hypothetical protein